ncbi:MAG: hypothetical protein Q9169_008012, partial [Polycauliona sp. 2 TL-2023]
MNTALPTMAPPTISPLNQPSPASRPTLDTSKLGSSHNEFNRVYLEFNKLKELVQDQAHRFVTRATELLVVSRTDNEQTTAVLQFQQGHATEYLVDLFREWRDVLLERSLALRL